MVFSVAKSSFTKSSADELPFPAMHCLVNGRERAECFGVGHEDVVAWALGEVAVVAVDVFECFSCVD